MLFFLLGLSKKKGCCTSGNTLSFVYFFLKMAVCEGIEPTPRATKVLLSRQFVEPTNIHTRMAVTLRLELRHQEIPITGSIAYCCLTKLGLCDQEWRCVQDANL